MNKKNEGITLIALVITIIVLLILAGISISVITGNNGILKQTTIAKENTEQARAEEEVKMAMANYLIESKTEEAVTLKKMLDENLEQGQIENFSANSKVATFTYKNQRFKINLENNEVMKDDEFDKWDGVTEKQQKGLVGSGTEESPYLIKCADDLIYFNNVLCNYEKITGLDENNSENGQSISAQNASFKLTANISLENKKWTPLGKVSDNSLSSFYGKFDGNGYEITNISEEENSFVGFFANLESGSEVKNLRITNSTFNQNVSGKAGGIAASAYNSKIEDCYFSGVISTSGAQTGGIVGYMSNGIIKNCTSNTKIVSSDTYVGGIIGNGYVVNIESTNNIGDISGIQHIGGIAGSLSGTIKKCYNQGNISSSGQHIGGLIGSIGAPGTEIEEGYNLGEININGTAYDCGGLIGVVSGGNNNKISNSYNKGNINGNITYGGGIIGYSYVKVNVLNCKNVGSFNGTVTNKGEICGNSIE